MSIERFNKWLLFCLRCAGVLFCGFIVVSQLRSVSDVGDIGSAAPRILVVVGGLLGIGLLVAPWLTTPIAEFVGDLFANLFYPSARFSKPGLSYVLARFYREEGRLEEAIEAYQKILKYYPNERDAYLELISVARETEARGIADKYTHLYQKRFRELPGDPQF